jgi:hypothetical protein
MSQDARMRAVIDEAVARATEPLKKRVEELSARLAAVEDSSGPSPTPEQKRAPAGRTARARGSADGKAEDTPKTGQ